MLSTTQRFSGVRVLLTAVVLAVMLGLAPGSALASHIERLPVSAIRGGLLTFNLHRLHGTRIRAARLVGSGHGKPVGLAKVRRASFTGVLHVLRPHWARQAVGVSLSVRVSGPAPGASAPAASASPAPGATGPGASTTANGPSAVASGAALNTGCAPAWGGLGGLNHAPSCWRPYSDSSPFNRMIAPNAPLAPNSAAMISTMMSYGTPNNLLAGESGGNDGGRPLYFSKPTDPVFTLHCTEAWGVCPLEGAVIHVPDGAAPSGGSDAHLTVIDQLTGWEYDLWTVASIPHSGGVLSFGWGGKTRIDGDGLGSGAVAANYGSAAGILRAEELQAGQINHALFLDVKCDSGHFVYPANKTGQSCAAIGLPTGAALPMGSRLQLTMSDDQINALNVPDWKKTILRAMAHYGLILGDTGGDWGIAKESGAAYTSLGQPDPWVAFAQKVGAPYYGPDNDYVFNLRDGVDYAHNLRVVDPCVSQGTC